MIVYLLVSDESFPFPPLVFCAHVCLFLRKLAFLQKEIHSFFGILLRAFLSAYRMSRKLFFSVSF
jgi:hypothetical protein